MNRSIVLIRKASKKGMVRRSGSGPRSRTPRARRRNPSGDGGADVNKTRRMLTIACLAMGLLGLGAGEASAHYVYAQGYVYKSSTHCTWGRAELSHGSGGGYTKISVGGVWAANGACVNWSVSSAKFYYAGEARVKHELWKRNSNGSWSLCKYTSWKYSTYPIGGSSAGWVPTYDHAINYGSTPPCGTGTYGVTGYMQVLEKGVWRGGKLDGGQHVLPA